jgi:hypothetical protein
VAQVQLSLMQVKSKRRFKRICYHWAPSRGRLTRRRGGGCTRYWFTARRTDKWAYAIPAKRLRRGKYILTSRAIDNVGNIESVFSRSRGNTRTFSLR